MTSHFLHSPSPDVDVAGAAAAETMLPFSLTGPGPAGTAALGTPHPSASPSCFAKPVWSPEHRPALGPQADLSLSLIGNLFASIHL